MERPLLHALRSSNRWRACAWTLSQSSRYSESDSFNEVLADRLPAIAKIEA